MYDRISGILSNLPTTSQEAPAPSGLLPIGVEEPQYVLRKNKVKCPLCGGLTREVDRAREPSAVDGSINS